IMLDNMTPEDIKKAKKIIGKKAITEVSGGITLDNIEDYLKVKPDIISIGALTHSAKAADISLQIL
ncbi:MAG: nicotinate-nucleotide diphosphorylase (carboxylating), partial [Elusimicrobiaceae bacterium]|nr:nicotinate-nucleotide diphosphorylase (carboxylating) [Elusimicrobiaceae bacterium]